MDNQLILLAEQMLKLLGSMVVIMNDQEFSRFIELRKEYNAHLNELEKGIGG